MAENLRPLAARNMAIASTLRDCNLLKQKVADIGVSGQTTHGRPFFRGTGLIAFPKVFPGTGTEAAVASSSMNVAVAPYWSDKIRSLKNAKRRSVCNTFLGGVPARGGGGEVHQSGFIRRSTRSRDNNLDTNKTGAVHFVCLNQIQFQKGGPPVPGPAMHHRIADKLRSEIIDRADQMGLTQAEAQQLADALQQPENLAYYFLGCQGPDPFFFNTKDVSPAVAQFVGIYLDFVTAIEEIKEVIRTAFHPAIVAVNAAIDASSTLQQIEAAYQDVKQVIDAIMPLITTAVTRFITEFNVFDLLDHPYRDGAKPGEWWWFDCMHYRRTGRIASELLTAERDVTSPTHLYALGYLTHVGADTVGHAYVNLWSGGPYRSQAQRHKTGENFQDVAYFDPGTFNPNAPFESSRLHWLYNFNYDGTEDETDEDDDGPAALTQLPDDLAKTIADALNRVYDTDGDGAPDFASRIDAGDVKDAYRLYFAFLKSSTETIPEPEPYSLSEELEEVWGRATDRLAGIGDFINDSGSFAGGSSGLLGFLKMLARAVLGALAAAAALVDAVLATIATIGLAGLRASAALVYEQVYNAWEMLREGVALGGLGFPLERHLANPIFQQFLRPDVDDPTGIDASDVVGQEPLLRFDVGFLQDPLANIFNEERHLVYPLTDGEKRSTGVAPSSYLNRSPVHYAQGSIPLEPTLLDDLSGTSPLTEADIARIMSKGTLGNAIDLSAELFGRWRRGGILPDFNLDADRGYGYPCWTQQGDVPTEPQALKTNADGGDPREVSLRTIRTGGEA